MKKKDKQMMKDLASIATFGLLISLLITMVAVLIGNSFNPIQGNNDFILRVTNIFPLSLLGVTIVFILTFVSVKHEAKS